VRIPDLAACVPFYGRHPAPEEAAVIQAPLLLHHAGLDEGVNASWPAFQKALQDADHDFTEYTYADVNHGFHNDTTPRYNEAAAKLAWERTIRHFTEHL